MKSIIIHLIYLQFVVYEVIRNFEGQLKVTHDLDFDETIILTSGVTIPC